MLDVLLLGNGAMVPLPRRWLSSVLLRINGSMVLFDCGEGTQISWRRFHWGFKRLDAICLSHHHADHVAGLPGLWHTVSNAGRTEPLHIYGPVGTEGIIHGLRVIAPWLGYRIVVHELRDGDTFVLPNGMHGRVAEGDHRIPVLAYRFDIPRRPGFLPEKAKALGVPRRMWNVLQHGEAVQVDGQRISPEQVMTGPRGGVSVALVTDTRPTDGVRALIKGVDLLVSEATYGDDADAGKAVAHKHMTFREAATLARDANATGLWLTHFGVGLVDPSVWDANARDVFPAVELGYDGMTGQLTFDAGYEPTGPAPLVRGSSPESVDSMNDEIAEISPT